MEKRAALKKQLYQTVKESIYREIVEPLLPGGGEMPTKKELSVRYGVNVGTVDKALQELELSGLIKKRAGIGTMALPQSEANEGSFGIFLSIDLFGDRRIGEFNFKLFNHVQEALLAKGRGFRHYIDMRPDAMRGKPLPQLIEDIERKRISSLIVARFDWRYDLPWLGELQVPAVSLNCDFGWGAPATDMKSAGFEAARKLLAKGCKNIQLLSVIPEEWSSSKETVLTNRPLRAGMANALMPEGIPAPEPWLTQESYPPAVRDMKYPFDDVLKGYELCKALFKAARPDGLVVYTDIMAIGAVKAMRELGLEPGRDVYCVIVGNEGVSFPETEGLPRVDMPVSEIASALISLADSAVAGEEPRSVFIKFKA